MTPANYILDDRFEAQLLAGQIDNGEPFVIDGPNIASFLRLFNPAETTTVTYKADFDNSILAWRYGFVPYRMIDAMGMVRALRSHELASVSLEKAAEHLGCGKKGNALASVKGMRREQIMGHPGLWKAFQEYATQDVRLTAAIYDKLAPEFPTSERRVMDLVLRCTIEPAFQIDVPMLEAHLIDVRHEKEDLLAACGNQSKDNLMSTDGFRELLEACGVEIEMKQSPSHPDKLIPAFAKTDDFMEQLLNHEDPEVQALAAARLGHKSTLEETRGERMLSIANLPWMDFLGQHNLMPIPLRYGAAHTHRLGGDWKMNMQNLPSGRGGKVTKLRKALIAPPGYKVIVADEGQIEARLTAWLCGQEDLLQLFAEGKDPYAQLACIIFNLAAVTPDSIERFIGKGGVLGLGFGCGKKKFFSMVIRQARSLGMDMNVLRAMWTPELAEKSVNVYRRVNSNICDMWQTLDFILNTAWSGVGGPAKIGPVTISRGCVFLPNGMYLRYVPLLGGTDKKYRYGREVKKIYGAAFLENIIQALARIVVMNAAIRLANLGLPFKLQSHDELAFIVPDDQVDKAKEIIHTEMVRQPSWAPGLPLKASVGFGQSYAEAK